jgi:hypothetical protein
MFLLSIASLMLSCGSAQVARVPAVLVARAEPQPGQYREIYRDERYAFATVNLGPGGPGGAWIPGFYVYSVATQEWRRVNAVSTRNAELGYSPSFEESRRLGVPYLSVAWDYRHLTREEYLPLPLRASGSIVLPREVSHKELGVYYLNCNPSLPAPFATVFRVPSRDFDEAFRK